MPEQPLGQPELPSDPVLPKGRIFGRIKKALESFLKVVEATCAAALVIITWRYTHAAYRQAGASETAANAARGAVEVASDTLKESQKNNTSQAALAEKARISSEASEQETLRASVETSHQDQRAWLGIPSVGLSSKNGQDFAVFHIINTGKTPATKVLFHFLYDNVISAKYQGKDITSDRKFIEDFSNSTFDVGNKGTVIPSGGFFTWQAGRRVDSWAVPGATVQGYVHGRVSYDDIFGKHHWLIMCFFRDINPAPDPNVGFTPCVDHNEIDNN